MPFLIEGIGIVEGFKASIDLSVKIIVFFVGGLLHSPQLLHQFVVFLVEEVLLARLLEVLNHGDVLGI